MQTSAADPLLAKMEELRLSCDREIQTQQYKLDSSVVSFQNSLQSSKDTVLDTINARVKLDKLKASLIEVENDLEKALAVEARKEEKKIATLDSISSTKSRIEELKRLLQDQKTWKIKYGADLHEQSLALAKSGDKSNENIERRRNVQEAMAWYGRALGFRIEGGCGVKFIFTNINMKNPMDEYSFTIRHDNDIYTLLDCNPHLSDTEKLIHELNITNGLFRFVRIMRVKFQEAAACVAESESCVTSLDQECASISLSAPVSSVSTDSRSESPCKQLETEANLQIGDSS